MVVEVHNLSFVARTDIYSIFVAKKINPTSDTTTL